jgi:hypothetical protein
VQAHIIAKPTRSDNIAIIHVVGFNNVNIIENTVITKSMLLINWDWIVFFSNNNEEINLLLNGFYCALFVLCTLCCQFSGLSFLIAPSVFSNIYLSCVLCTLCCQFSGLSFLIAPSAFSNIYLSCVLCTLCCQFSGLSFLISPSVSNL